MLHPSFARRDAIIAGASSVLGLGLGHFSALRAATTERQRPKRNVIFVFLSGGLGQHDSFDMKPDAPDNIRGEFSPIATATPGTFICEHLPQLATRSSHWSLVRSLTHPYNEHSQGHMVMLSGRTPMPVGFSAAKPGNLDWPSIPSIVGKTTVPRGNLPPAVILPEKLIHRTGRVIPGQFAGLMGARNDPWLVSASPFNSKTYGAYPEYEFHHQRGGERTDGLEFAAPNLSLPHGLTAPRLTRRLSLLETLESQVRTMDASANSNAFDSNQGNAVSLLTDRSVRKAFDVTSADDATLERYGRHSFGWSLLMARRLVEAGVNIVQVNLGNNEAWDTHGNAFPHLKDYLYPPFDQSLSALLDDLKATGQLSETLIVVAGEFGRTPKVFGLPQHYKLPGRDHWGAVQSVLLAGGGIAGGRVIGSTDAQGAFPEEQPETPESLAATIYESIGLPRDIAWKDELNRPHFIYHGRPIPGLT